MTDTLTQFCYVLFWYGKFVCVCVFENDYILMLSDSYNWYLAWQRLVHSTTTILQLYIFNKWNSECVQEWERERGTPQEILNDEVRR